MKKVLFVLLVLAAVFTAGCITSSQIPPGCGGLQTDEECAASIAAATPTPTEPPMVVKSEQVQATPMPTEAMVTTPTQTVSGTESISGSTTPWLPVIDTSGNSISGGKNFHIDKYNADVSIMVGSTVSTLMWLDKNNPADKNLLLTTKVTFRNKLTGQTVTAEDNPNKSYLRQGDCSAGIGCGLPPLKDVMPDADPKNAEWQAEFQIKEQ